MFFLAELQKFVRSHVHMMSLRYLSRTYMYVHMHTGTFAHSINTCTSLHSN